MIIYSVKSGDSLWVISQKFNIPMKSIIDVNGLTEPNDLVIGMELVIPIDTVTYVVRPGDSLWSIGQKFNINYVEIAFLNNIKYPYPLTVGQELDIPIKKLEYTVRPGDSLWSIAQNFNIPVSQIITLSDIQPPYTIYPGQVLIIFDNENLKTTIETLGYYRTLPGQDNISVINELGEYLTYLGVFDFPITSSGEILGELDMDMLNAALNKGVTVLPVLTNLSAGSFSPTLANEVLSNDENLNNLIDNTLKLLERYNLKGVIIDFENLYPRDREIYTRFIRLLSEALHENDKILVVDIAPKWSEWPERDWVGFFDYNALGDYVDIAALMTYEWGWREGPPGPTAPIDNVRRVLDYAIANNIPAEKILMGMTLYGYDWELPDTPENLATTVTLPQVWDLGRINNAKIYFDQESKQPYMNYIDKNNKKHEVWFENALSHYYEYLLAEDYGLRGVFYWILNQPFASTWYILSSIFNVRKLI